MENLKVKVNKESESKEAQELFVTLGGSLVSCKRIGMVAMNDEEIYPDVVGNWESYSGKEITLPYLRDLVVLKRNDVWDANYTYCGKPVLKLETQDYKVWNKLDKCWVEHIGSQTDLRTGLKPIGKKEMKEPKQAEFLVKTAGGYVLQVLDESAGGTDVVRAPDGAEIAVKSNRGYVEFRKGRSFYAEEWCEGSWHVNDFPKHEWDIVWKRETLNDQVASAEEYREMISNAASIGLTSVVTDIAQSCSGGAIRNASSQGQSEFPLNNYELNHRVAKAFNAVRGTDLNEDDVNYIRELINLTISHYGERK